MKPRTKMLTFAKNQDLHGHGHMNLSFVHPGVNSMSDPFLLSADMQCLLITISYFAPINADKESFPRSH